MCGRLGSKLCNDLAKRTGGEDRFDAPPGGQYGGWHQYMWKDLRKALGENVSGAYKVKYCGEGDVNKCAGDLWKAFEEGLNAEAASKGSNPALWRVPESGEDITFSPVSLITMDYTNRPSGIHQVMDFSD